MSDLENQKLKIINMLRSTIADLDTFNEPCCDDDEIFRKGLVAGLGVAIESIKRGGDRRLIEYALDSYREEHAGEDYPRSFNRS
jgi:hypothetical protein